MTYLKSAAPPAVVRVLICVSLVTALSHPSDAADLRWNSTTDARWDLTTSNWFNLATSSLSRFASGDSVRLDDSGGYVANLTLTLPLSPSSLTVDSSALHYHLAGPGKLSGLAQGLTKNGTSTLTLSTANDFSGPVQVNAGRLRLGNATALGAPAAGTTVAAGATLDLAGFGTGTEPFLLSGAGQNNQGAIMNTGAPLIDDGLGGAVTLTGDATLGGTSRWSVKNGPFAGNDFKLTKTGPSEIILGNLGQTGLGDIEVQQGVLTFFGTTLLGNTNHSLLVRSNATLAFGNSGPRVFHKTLFLESAEVRNDTAGGVDTTTLTGPVFLTGTNLFDLASSIRLQGEVGGLGGITKRGPGTLRLDNDNFYGGDTLISAGRVALGADGGLGGSQAVILETGAVLDVTALSSFRVRGTQVFTGNGTVAGSLTLGSGSFTLPGLKLGTLTVTGDLIAEDTAELIVELGSDPSEGAGMNDLLRIEGNVSLNGLNRVRVQPVGVLSPSSPYTFLSYSGTLNGGANNLTAISDTRMTFGFDTSAPGKIRVRVLSGEPAVLTWNGGAVGAPLAWDVKTTANWKKAAAPDLFHAGDTAIFNDTAAQFTVQLSEDLFPAAIRVEANLNHYSFTGPGRLRGGALTKTQAGTLTIANQGVNDYPGPTTIQAGAIQVGNGGTAGNLGPGPVVNQGRLIFHRSDPLLLANTLTGTGLLEKRGANTLTLPASVNGFDGSIVVHEGTLSVLGVAGGSTGEVRIASGATLVGTGTIRGHLLVQAGATLAPGLTTDAGVIGTLNTVASVGLSGTLLIDLSKTGAVLTNDRVVGTQPLTAGGTLTVRASGDALQAGNTFQIFGATGFLGAFATVNLPILSGGLSWDTSELASAGRLRVVAPSSTPTLITPVLNGNSLTLGATGGTPGGTYRIVASIDLFAPLSTWTEVASGAFDASGHLSVTLPLQLNEAEKYFAVRVP
jgi:fibronectin-binding autotransporter adhesin